MPKKGAKKTTAAASNTPPPSPPKIPKNVESIMAENSLDLLPPGRQDYTRPWFLYDYEDPAAKFRLMGAGYDWSKEEDFVERGENEAALIDYPRDEAKPVMVYGYQYVHSINDLSVFFLTTHRQKYQIEVSGPLFRNNHFRYQERELCDVKVFNVVYGKKATVDHRQLERPTGAELQKPTVYKIHAGYSTVLRGFLREIELMYDDSVQEHNCLFRATYLLKILDHFAAELPAISSGIESRWRSRVLNPILQRQLRGVFDQEPEMVEKTIGPTLEDAANFYLQLDPLGPDRKQDRLRNILYVWPVRWSLAYMGVDGTQDSYTRTRITTEHLLEERGHVSDEDYNSRVLMPYEYTVICQEKLGDYYEDVITNAVRPNPLFTLG
jgi:hypothetical protein